MKSNVSPEISSSLFAGWHDLGVQKYKISKAVTQNEKAGSRTAVTVQGKTLTVTNNLMMWDIMWCNVCESFIFLLCLFVVQTLINDPLTWNVYNVNISKVECLCHSIWQFFYLFYSVSSILSKFGEINGTFVNVVLLLPCHGLFNVSPNGER